MFCFPFLGLLRPSHNAVVLLSVGFMFILAQCNRASAGIVRAELYAGCSMPQWGITDYPIGPDGFQGNYWYGTPQSLGDTTRGNYYTIIALRQSQSIWDNSFFDTGIILYWNLSQLPRN